MFDLAALGGPGSSGYLGYCPCKSMDPAGPWGVFLNAADREFLQDYSPQLQRKERDGRHRDKGDLKEQAQRHCHAQSTATTPLVPPQPGGHRHPGGAGVAFPAWSRGALPSHTAPPFHLPFSDPSTVPAPQRAPWGAGHTPQSPSFLPGARKAPGAPTAGALAAVPLPAQNRTSTQIWGFSG